MTPQSDDDISEGSSPDDVHESPPKITETKEESSPPVSTFVAEEKDTEQDVIKVEQSEE